MPTKNLTEVLQEEDKQTIINMMEQEVFRDKYLGSHATAPTTDNQGGVLVEGVVYWNSTTKKHYTWNATAWEVWNSGVTTDTAQDITAEKNYTVPPKVDGVSIGGYSGFKNYIINGKKVVNQREITTTDYGYVQDRWFKSTDNNWFQGIEGNNNLINGKTYTLSWEGIAEASYYVGTATNATINAQTFTPIANGGNLTLTIAAGQNLWVKFASDASGSTFNFVQLEEGAVKTNFEHRPYALELSLCERYFIKTVSIIPLTVGRLTSGITTGTYAYLAFPSTMRTIPSYADVSVINGTLSVISLFSTGVEFVVAGNSASSIPRLSAGIQLSAEL